MPVVRLQDVILNPVRFDQLTVKRTMEKSALIKSGALLHSPRLSELLNGEGTTFAERFFNDLDNDEAGVASDDPNQMIDIDSITMGTETQVATRRAKSWGSMNLVRDLMGGIDPLNQIVNLTAAYWERQMQRMFLSIMKGVFDMNAAAPQNNSTHLQNDMTHDIRGSSFVKGVTSISGDAIKDAKTLLGDARDQLGIIMCHTNVANELEKLQGYSVVPDAQNPSRAFLSMFHGMPIIIDDAMPNTGGVYETWIMARGTMHFGASTSHINPSAIIKEERSGNGWGGEQLIQRQKWCMHPTGNAWRGTAAAGGPTNAQLATAANWIRVAPERKQVPVVRLITREH